MSKVKCKQLGFTLIEVIVSLFILGVSLTAILFIFSTSITSATTVRNNFVGGTMAQEGAEIMNNLRHEDWITGRPFGSFGNIAGVLADGIYRVQWNSSQPIFIGSNPPILIDSTTGLYSYDSGVSSGFSRSIEIDTVIVGVQKRITSTVTWSDNRGNTKVIEVESHLFNWR